MRHEVRAVYRSPRAMLSGPSAADATRQALQAGPVCIVARQLEPGITGQLDAMAAADLPVFDASGPLDRVRAAIAAAFATSCDPIRTWLRDDILALLGLYAAATGSRTVRGRLKAVNDDMCRAFHVDNVAFRLVTTYRGPGTQWMAPDRLAREPHGQPLPPTAIRDLERGTVAILRGAKAATPEHPGLLHRSPPIAGAGITRLFLAINEVGG